MTVEEFNAAMRLIWGTFIITGSTFIVISTIILCIAGTIMLLKALKKAINDE